MNAISSDISANSVFSAVMPSLCKTAADDVKFLTGFLVKAQEQIATRHTRGKIVLQVADEPKG